MSYRPEGNVRIISRNGEPFQDRAQAGRLLAEQLVDLRGADTAVLGVPRGGVVTAGEIARVVDGDLDIVLSRKLGAPGQPELAMGSLAEDGTVFLNPGVVRSLDISTRDIDLERTHQLAEMRRRAQLIRGAFPKVPLRDRVVVVTDDGIATGATLQAALWGVRHEKPRKLIAAVPVASEESLTRLANDADVVICLLVPPQFHAVGQWYREFTQVDDMDVLRILEEQSNRRSGPEQSSAAS